MEEKGKVMDLSKCGGICKGDCKHYAIGLVCPDEATYEQKDSDTIKVIPNQYCPEGIVTCGPETAKQLKSELDRLTRESTTWREAHEAIYSELKQEKVKSSSLRGEVGILRGLLAVVFYYNYIPSGDVSQEVRDHPMYPQNGSTKLLREAIEAALAAKE